MEFISDRHEYSMNSIPTKTTNSNIPTDRPSYHSKVIDGVFYAAIFNGTFRNTYWINGVETEDDFLVEGQAISDWKTYEEGCEHSWDFMIKDMGYRSVLGPVVYINTIDMNRCTSIDNENCQILSTHKAVVNNVSGDLSYAWNVSNATIESGQGTDTVVIKTIDKVSRKILLQCVATDDYISTPETKEVIHYRMSKDGYNPLLPTTILEPSPILVPQGE